MISVKICGITRPEDARAALEAGADAIGLNFVPGTPRALEESAAREIAAVVAGHALRVGVFRDAPIERVREIAAAIPLDVIQLHGDESPEYAASLELPVIKVLRADPDLLDRAAAYPKLDLLLDHPSGGGSGQGWDFGRARALVAAGRRVWLAGGLSADNVADAVRRALPHGVDA